MKTNWNGCTLYSSLRSPFARRVRVAFLAAGLEFNDQIIDAWNPEDSFFEKNPLGRVPTLEFANGESLCESTLILNYFYETKAKELNSKFCPKNEEDLFFNFQYSALACGLIEKAIEYFLENTRPLHLQEPTTLAEYEDRILRTLAYFEKALADKKYPFTAFTHSSQIDWVCALDYVSFRYGNHWKEKFPLAEKFRLQSETLSEFQKTKPV